MTWGRPSEQQLSCVVGRSQLFWALSGDGRKQPQFPLLTYTGQATLDGYVFYNLIDITIALPMPAAIKRKLI